MLVLLIYFFGVCAYIYIYIYCVILGMNFLYISRFGEFTSIGIFPSDLPVLFAEAGVQDTRTNGRANPAAEAALVWVPRESVCGAC